MDAKIKEEGVLEVKALVMDKAVFNQLENSDHCPDIIELVVGRVISDVGERAIVKTLEGVGGLVKVRWSELHPLAMEELKEQTRKGDVLWKDVQDYLFGKMRASVPQIFIK